MIVPTLT
jgi:hypothetical protein